MDEQTRRHITWIVVVGAIAVLAVVASGRRGELDRLRADLAYGSPEDRIAAVERLVETQKLADGITNQPRWVQDNVVEAAAYIGTEKAIFQLMSAWGAVDAPVQPRITAAISRLGELAIPPVVEAMVDKDAKFRAGAPTVLIALGEPTIPYLLPHMGAWDDYIRTGVSTAFGGIAGPVCPELVKILKAPPPAGDQQGTDTAEYLRRKDAAIASFTLMAVKSVDCIIADLLPAEDPEVRGQAAALLGTIGAALVAADQPKVIPALVQRMGTDSSWTVRRKAAVALGGMGAVGALRGVPDALIARLKDVRPEVRAAAAESLGKVAQAGAGAAGMETAAKALEQDVAAAVATGRQQAVRSAQVLSQMLVSNQSGASREISAALVRVGPLAVAPLQPGLASPSGDVRLWVTSTIAQIGGAQAVPPLARALRDPSYQDVRRTAADALRNQPAEALSQAPQAVLPALAAALQDPDFQVYYAARDALAKIGQPAVPALVGALASANSRVGYLAEMALARIGAPAVPGLVSALKSGNPVVVNWASIALGDIAEPSVVPLGRVLADGSASVASRSAAAHALGGTGMSGALAPLLNAAKDTNSAVRMAAVTGLGRLADPGGTEALVASLGDRDPSLRSAAMELLKDWRMGDVQSALKKALASSDTDMQRRAAVVTVFQNASVTNQLLREISSAGAGAQGNEGASVLTILNGVVTDTKAAPDVRHDAIVSLGYVGDQTSLQELEKLLQSGNPLALPAARSVAQVSARLSAAEKTMAARKELGAGTKLLLDLAENSTQSDLQLAAASGLATMGDIPVETLVDQLSEGSDEQRAWAGAVLAAIGKPATELLMKRRGENKGTWEAATLTAIGDAMALQILKHVPDEQKPQPAQLTSITTRLSQIRQTLSQ